MTLTPEQLAKSREEFEAHYKDAGKSFERDQYGNYFNDVVSDWWSGWLARHESLVVELDISKIIRDCVLKTELGAYAQSNLSGGFGLIDEIVKCAMQSAGINYREKE